MGRQLHRAPPRQRDAAVLGWLTGQRVDPSHHFGSEDSRSTRSRTVFQAGESLQAEALPPSRCHVDAHTDPLSNVHVLSAATGKQNDPGTDYPGMTWGARGGPFLEDGPLDITQLDLERRTTCHRRTSVAGPPHQENPTLKLHRHTYRQGH